MNAAANPQVVIAGLQQWIHSHSNDSVSPLKGCAIFDSKFGGNAVRVEYKACEPHQLDGATYEDMAVECFWFAGRAFDLEEVSKGQIEKWQKEAFKHAIEQGRQESLSIAINQMEAA